MVKFNIIATTVLASGLLGTSVAAMAQSSSQSSSQSGNPSSSSQSALPSAPTPASSTKDKTKRGTTPAAGSDQNTASPDSPLLPRRRMPRRRVLRPPRSLPLPKTTPFRKTSPRRPPRRQRLRRHPLPPQTIPPQRRNRHREAPASITPTISASTTRRANSSSSSRLMAQPMSTTRSELPKTSRLASSTCRRGITRARTTDSKTRRPSIMRMSRRSSISLKRRAS